MSDSNTKIDRAIAMADRIQWLKKRTGRDYPQFKLPDPALYEGLVEHQVGYVAFPVSVIGPVLIKGEFVDGDIYVPLCALEGALALSMNRGALLTRMSGGIVSTYIEQRISRSPLFAFRQAFHALECSRWISANFDKLRAVAEETTNHGKLLRIEHYPINNRLILDAQFSTGEAAGQNMITFAIEKVCQYIKQNYPKADNILYHLIESNFSGDKNAAFRNIILGRGHSVIAETMLSPRHVRRLLRIEAKKLCANAHNDALYGTYMSGTLGLNTHTINALSAIYLATGQDIACAAENCGGMLAFEMIDDHLRVSITMRSLTVGSIGGATRLPQQRANLELLGCDGPNASGRLAEIVASMVLCLEISLAGAVSSGEFADAHRNYGRVSASRVAKYDALADSDANH